MAKALGREIKNFWENAWPEDYFHDDSVINITNDNGDVILDLTKEYDLADCGWLIHNSIGKGMSPISFEEAFLTWKNEQTVAYIQVEVQKDNLQEAKEKIEMLGYKVL